jgi:hypothetical protein
LAEPQNSAPVDARAQKRTEVAARRKRVAELHIAKISQIQIAKEVGVSNAQVSRDLVKIRAQWREEYLADMNKVMLRELATLDDLERRTRARIVTCPEDERIAFCRLQETVIKIMDRRAKFLGMDAPQKIAVEGATALRVEFVNDWQRGGGDPVVVVDAQARVLPEATGTPAEPPEAPKPTNEAPEAPPA